MIPLGSGIKNYFQQRFERWIDRRLPPAKVIQLDSRKLFIFPSRAGLFFISVVLVVWLVATNYENNVVFGFAFLLIALFVVAIHHSFLNLSGVAVTGVRSHPVFAGQSAEFEIQLQQRGNRYRDSIQLRYGVGEPVVVALPATETARVRLAVPAVRRGWLRPGRLTVESQYPFGLLRVWTHLHLDQRALVYPAPLAGSPPLVTQSGRGDGPLLVAEGSEDFVGLQRYKAGESLRHVAWKHYAREQGMMSKHYADPVDDEIWLDWEAFPGLDQERRLSRLCDWLLTLSHTTSPYGLRLPGIEIAPATGKAHRDQLLRELALFGIQENAGED